MRRVKFSMIVFADPISGKPKKYFLIKTKFRWWNRWSARLGDHGIPEIFPIDALKEWKDLYEGCGFKVVK